MGTKEALEHLRAAKNGFLKILSPETLVGLLRTLFEPGSQQPTLPELVQQVGREINSSWN